LDIVLGEYGLAGQMRKAKRNWDSRATHEASA